LFWLVSHAAFAANILVIENYHEGYVWDASYIRGLKQVIDDKHTLTFFEMDTKRIPELALRVLEHGEKPNISQFRLTSRDEASISLMNLLVREGSLPKVDWWPNKRMPCFCRAFFYNGQLVKRWSYASTGSSCQRFWRRLKVQKSTNHTLLAVKPAQTECSKPIAR